MKKQGEKNHKTVGQALADLRESKNVTQEKLEELSGIPRRTIQNIEYGVVKEPKLRVVRTLLNAMGCGFTELKKFGADNFLVAEEDNEPTLAEAPPLWDRRVIGSLSAEDLGRAIQGLLKAGPARQAYVLFLVTRDKSYLERLTPEDRQALRALDPA